MNRVEQLYRESPRPTLFARGYLNYLSELCGRLDTDAIARFIDVLLQARERQARIFFVGNGGSASTASHFANDVAIGTRCEQPFRAISLTDNAAILTAIANDYGYEEIFVRQLKTHMTPGDVVVAISASGNSSNVVKAIEYANNLGGVTVALTGFDGGKLAKISRVCVHVPTGKGEYGPVEDIHMILDHLVGAFLINVCAAPSEQ
jgi:D-sedoheptulose 7-phosphate isomerase